MKKILLALSFLFLSVSAFAADAKESVFDHVMRTNTLRCGYWNWQPGYWTDNKTSKPAGIFFDITNELGRVANIKIEWTQEVQFAHLITDLQEGRVDAICAGVWPSASRARQILFSDPVFYTPINAYVKVGDKRFDGKLATLNDKSVKIGTMDGEMSADIKNTDFPLSRGVSIPQIAGTGSELLMIVSTGKADVTFTDAAAGNEFMKANPGKVRVAATDVPLRTMPNAFAVKGDEARLKDFLDEVLAQLQNSGVTEKILKKYDSQFPDALMRPAKPFEVKK